MKRFLFLMIAFIAVFSVSFADTIPAIDTLANVEATLLDSVPAIDATLITPEIVSAADATSSGSLLSIVIPAILGIITVLLSDSAKHMKDGTWNLSIFFMTKIKPAIITIALTLAAYFITTLNLPLPDLILQLFSDNIEAFSLVFGGTLAAVIDGLLKSNKTK